jgi:hypothetical protein
VLAAYVSGGRAHEVPAVMEAMKISSKDSFEVAFNFACSLLAAGDFERAHKELEHAQRLGGQYLARCHIALMLPYVTGFPSLPSACICWPLLQDERRSWMRNYLKSK